ncbi:hypothetical protein BKA70DRAFT_464490 [Coprinopsis sp. MPI-PUGE-AT-0042]|nr:hypothetical protein BKA70DRAFT_464490 [Coprinopsis sp. MPI-PUGE-AT-0042]
MRVGSLPTTLRSRARSTYITGMCALNHTYSLNSPHTERETCHASHRRHPWVTVEQTVGRSKCLRLARERERVRNAGNAEPGSSYLVEQRWRDGSRLKESKSYPLVHTRLHDTNDRPSHYVLETRLRHRLLISPINPCRQSTPPHHHVHPHFSHLSRISVRQWTSHRRWNKAIRRKTGFTRRPWWIPMSIQDLCSRATNRSVYLPPRSTFKPIHRLEYPDGVDDDGVRV